MLDQKTKRRILFILIVMGLAFAALAGLADRVTWLQSLCAFFSDACKEAAEVVLFKIPIWAWGLAFYAALGLSLFWFPFLFPWLLAVGIGVEAALIGIALSITGICLFCVGNLVVILLVVVFSFEKRLFWRTLAISSLSFIFSTFLIPGQKASPISDVAQKQGPQIIARVAGEEITREEIERPLAPRIHDFELQAYRLKKWQLENLIGRKVLQKEAEELGITLDQMIKDKRFSQGVEVSEVEVNEYLERNWDRLRSWRGSPEELKTRVHGSLRQKKVDQRLLDYVRSLYPKYDVAVYLEEPEYPYARVKADGDYFTGPPDAAVTVFEFSDYECPACQSGHDVVRQVREIYKDRVKWVFKDYPLTQHKEAAKAAEATRCAGEQGRFWEYQDLLFAAKGQLAPERLREYAAELKLDTKAFGQCLDDARFEKRVKENIAEARKAGVERLPTFVIGGKLITGKLSVERFQGLIDEELKRAQGGP
ncbi:MAG: thioredoxin domain-containing protein [Proteobacteria bacterium]|nr:thioredoxin domain-containing protein [Pseudomonadota bacterium]